MATSALILHVTDEFRDFVSRVIQPLSLGVRTARTSAPIDESLRGLHPDLVIVELERGDPALLESLLRLRQAEPSCAVLAVATPAAASAAVEAMGAAVDDYTLAPPVPRELLARCHRVLASRDLHRRLDLLQVELNRRYGAHRIVCRSSAMEAVYNRVLQLAPTRTTVLISGESGSGKELIARSLHYNSTRRDQPFLALNCAAVAETLIDSELFGHQRGAFTGAVETVPGKFELANGGTLFLDELGTMGLATQSRLLRVLEQGEFMRVGGTKTLRVDVRVLAATNTDLDEQVKRGEFRKDLLYRLRVATIDVPPLRRRRDDIPVLARDFMRQSCEENGLPPKDLSPETIEALLRHDWPGNVRELKNLMETLAVTLPEPVVRPEHLPEGLREGGSAPPSGSPYRVGLPLAEVERLFIADTLAACGGNRTRAARLLGIGIRTLQRKLAEYRLDEEPEPGHDKLMTSAPRRGTEGR